MLPFLMMAGVLAVAPQVDTLRLVVVATTDVHGYATDWDYLQNAPWPGGLARVATVVDSLRDRYPGQVLVVDAGDALQGSPLAAYYGRGAARDPHPVIDAMNTIGYDAATPGDHDFDFGLPAFQRAIAGSSFHWVSGNLRVLPSDTLALASYVVVVRNGVRVAVTGFTTPAAMVLNRSRFGDQLRVDRIEPGIEPVLREARKDADLVIALAHTGLGGRASYDTTGLGGEDVAEFFAAGASRPDLVVAGHSHEEIVDTVIHGVHFVQPRAQGRSLAVLHVTLVGDRGQLRVVGMRAERVALEEVRPSAQMARRLAEPHRAMLGWVSTVLGESERRLTLATARAEDLPLPRWMHAVQRRASGAALSLVPVFDLRAGFDEGEITMGELFRLYPAEYTLRAVRLTGAQLRAVMEQGARYYFVDSAGRVAPNRYAPGANFELLGGAAWTLDLSQPPGSRITRLEVGGRPLGPDDSVTVAVSSFRQQGGGNATAFAGAPVVYDKGEAIRDLLQADLARRHTLRAEALGEAQWTLAPAEYAERARALFVRGPAPAPAPEPAPAPLQLPTPPSNEEIARRDSIARAETRAEARADSIARHAVATLRLPAAAGPEGAAARLLADAYRNALRADVALARGDELPAGLPAGPLTATLLDSAMPDRPLLLLRMKGADILALLENLVAEAEPCCAIAGLRVEYDPRRKPFDRVRRVRLLNGRSLDRSASYAVALSAALLGPDSAFALGAADCRDGGGCRTPGALDRFEVSASDRTSGGVLREYLRRLPQPVALPTDRRLVPNR